MVLEMIMMIFINLLKIGLVFNMAMTEETITIKVNLTCSYTYKGEEMGFNEKDMISKNIKDELSQKLFEIVEWECNGEREDLDVIIENIDSTINGKDFGY